MVDADIKWLERFGEWKPEKELSLSKLEAILKTTGVYALLADIPRGRCIGQSRILYIGNGFVGDRLWCVIDPTHGEKHAAFAGTQRLKHQEPKLKLSFTYLGIGKKEAEEKETVLLRACEETFGELPPFNCQRGKED